MTDLPQFVGRFPILDLLGVGGMGIVYLAEDPDIGRKVAIKVLHASENNLALDRFKNEARTIGELSHPNIVMLLEYGVEDNRPYLVMEYLPGISLEDWIDTPHTLAEHKKVLIGLCQALRYAHEKNILHRDLKLGNVQVLPSGESKLLDFGIARSQDVHLTTTGFFVGTPKYLAPEILSNSNHSSVSDCYSLGLVAYTIFCNRDPYQAPTFEGIVARKLTLTPLPLSKTNSAIPKNLSQVIAAYLEKDPNERPQNPDALEAVLRDMTDANELQRVIEYKTPNNESNDDVTLIGKKLPFKNARFYYAGLVLILMVAIGGYIFSPFSEDVTDKDLGNKEEINANLKKTRNTNSTSLDTLGDSKKQILIQPKKGTLSDRITDTQKDTLEMQQARTKEKPQKKAKDTTSAPIKKTNQSSSTKSIDRLASGTSEQPTTRANQNKSKKTIDKLPQQPEQKIVQERLTIPLQDQSTEEAVATHVIIPKLLLQPISRKSNRIKLKLNSSGSLARGKTIQLKLSISQDVTIKNFKFFRGRKELDQISILKIETLAKNELLLHLYIDPNTKLGEYSLVGYYKNRKTNTLSIKVTL
ncbi:MAG: serine/threonine-protein kinase [Enterobacterales bacterium]|nr:serine/threonine-protein kinase [Enterobacterales bacterium]